MPSFSLPAPSRPREGEFPLYYILQNLSIENLYKHRPKINPKFGLTSAMKYAIIYM